MTKRAQKPSSATEQPDYAESHKYVVPGPEHTANDPQDAHQHVEGSDQPPGSLHQRYLPRVPVPKRRIDRRAWCVTDRVSTAGTGRGQRADATSLAPVRRSLDAN